MNPRRIARLLRDLADAFEEGDPDAPVGETRDPGPAQAPATAPPRRARPRPARPQYRVPDTVSDLDRARAAKVLRDRGYHLPRTSKP